MDNIIPKRTVEEKITEIKDELDAARVAAEEAQNSYDGVKSALSFAKEDLIRCLRYQIKCQKTLDDLGKDCVAGLSVTD